MNACRSGRHHWLNASDANKCCNGYVRVLVIGGGSNQQTAGDTRIGRDWMQCPAAAPTVPPAPSEPVRGQDGLEPVDNAAGQE